MVASSSLAVFSESRLQAISKRLGHNGLYDVIERMRTHTQARRNANKTSFVEARLDKADHLPVPAQEAERYARFTAYFEHIHPMYPFLNQKRFEEKVSGLQTGSLQKDIAWSALYHGVLALGSQFHNKGDFTPEKGLSWQLFKSALGLMPNSVGPDATLVNVQAIFSQNLSGYTLENYLVSEAIRLAITTNIHKPIHCADSRKKAILFWVIYCLEKPLCFNDGLTSLIVDSDIGCSVPEVSESVVEGYDWFLSSVTLARMLSIAYETLFSVKAANNSAEQFRVGISQVYAGLECWTMSIPKKFRPGESIKLHNVSITLTTTLLYQHFYYQNAMMAISRLAIHIGEPSILSEVGIGKSGLIKAARTILELTKYTDPKAWSPLWIVAAMPLAAMFILFESVVHDDPTSTDTKHNLFFLDMAAGYFSRLDYDSGGSFHGSIFSEFTFFARLFVYKELNIDRSANPDITTGSTNFDPLHTTPLGANDMSSQVSPIVPLEGLYPPVEEGGFPDRDYPLHQGSYSNLENDSIVVDFMEIFDPMLANEDWHW
ncbi:putative transcriptional regulatory protein [Lachnellula occidentalis]|uniref:Putative transcriptional regulatory protein n=1 Tax=Lachnellula occidentalis TaxID=215460 RepID=A0A8H8S7G4_9HELO|nr:putative transcriptional regulatory protein [Lachnellula occidentalis]